MSQELQPHEQVRAARRAAMDELAAEWSRRYPGVEWAVEREHYLPELVGRRAGKVVSRADIDLRPVSRSSEGPTRFFANALYPIWVREEIERPDGVGSAS